MRLVCVYYIVYSLIRLRKATDANCPNKHFVSPCSWPDCHHSFQPQARSLLWVEHVTFTGVDCTGEGQSELWISPCPHCSDDCLPKIQPTAPPESQGCIHLQSPTTAHFSCPVHSQYREEFISFPSAATTYIAAFMVLHLLLVLSLF